MNPWALYGAGQTRHENKAFDLPVWFGEPVHLYCCYFEADVNVPGGSVLECCMIVGGELMVDGKPSRERFEFDV